MSFTNAGLKAAVDGVAGAGSWISFHTADPGTSGASEVSGGAYARQQTTWATTANGTRAGSQTSTSIPASTTISYWGIWSAATGGTFIYGGLMPAPESFGSAGTEQFTPTLTVSG